MNQIMTGSSFCSSSRNSVGKASYQHLMSFRFSRQSFVPTSDRTRWVLQSTWFPRSLFFQKSGRIEILGTTSFDTHLRWQPVTQSARSRRSYGKIEDCEQSRNDVVSEFISLLLLSNALNTTRSTLTKPLQIYRSLVYKCKRGVW